MPKVYTPDSILEKLISVSINGDNIENPQDKLKASFNICFPTTEKYLRILAEQGRVELVPLEGGGKGRSISRVCVLKREMNYSASESHNNGNGAVVSVQKPAAPVIDVDQLVGKLVKELDQSQLRRYGMLQKSLDGFLEEIKPKYLAVLIDFDNVASWARDLGFEISWMRLNMYLSRIGKKIHFAGVYFSPKSANTYNICQVDAAGFTALVGPLAFKDKDGVDAKIRQRVNEFLDLKEISEIIIVARDGDYAEVMSRGTNLKTPIRMIAIDSIRKEIEGSDEKVVPKHSVRVRAYLEALKLLSADQQPLDSEMIQRQELMKDIILQMYIRERSENRTVGKAALTNLLLSKKSFCERWIDKGFGNEADLKEEIGRAFWAFTDQSEIEIPVILINQGRDQNGPYNYWALNTSRNPLIRRIAGAQPAVAPASR